MDLNLVVKSQRDYFNTDCTRDVEFRRNSLIKLYESINDNEEVIYAALKSDLGKTEQEAYMTEVGIVKESIRYAIKHIESWTKTKKVKTPMFLFPGKSRIVQEPYGVVLIIAHWNYPILLSLVPLVSAIAAGNCAIIKTSKNCPYTSSIIANIVNGVFDRKQIYVIDEAVPHDEILRQKYDYIFFSGSERVGKTVLRYANENMTPVTLEMGGKCPCIVDQTADVEMAAKKIMWGKLLNAGQSANAPDYVLVHETVKEQLISELSRYAKAFIGDPFTNDSYPHIVSLHHYMRLKNCIAREKNVIGGRGDDKRLIIEPTIIKDASYDSMIMKNEIFGPILPVITYNDYEEMVTELKMRQKPLALYLFSENDRFIKYVIERIPFGGGCINDVMLHVANENLPYGGVGNSGMGKYRGKAGFDTFSHSKSIYLLPSNHDMKQRYQPYSEGALESLRRIFR